MTAKFPKGFGSDNHSGILPEVLSAIAAVNFGHAPAYGDDEYTQGVAERFKTVFGPTARTHFVFNGTAANVLALGSCLKRYEAVICAATSHLNEDECGAPEAMFGLKLRTISTPDGKLRPEDLDVYLVRGGDQHTVQPRVLSVANSTETGGVYTIEEMRSLVLKAHENGLLVHVDGARLVNAAASCGCTLAALTTDVGVDVVSFGGTKHGLLAAEAVVFLNPALAPDFRFYRKQAMQLASKTRFLAAQFDAWLEGDLWRRYADHENRLAQRLATRLAQIPEVQLTYPVQANALFVTIPRRMLKSLREHAFFYVWDERRWEIRLMMTFDTTEGDVDRFAQAVEQLARECAVSTANE